MRMTPRNPYWLYSGDDFWGAVRINPMAGDEQREREFAELSKQTNVPVARLKKQYSTWLRVISMEREIHPGTTTVN